jgi:hypothetical protein
MNFLQKMLNDRIVSLEASEKTLAKVKVWATDRRDILDRIGPGISTADGEYMDVAHFEELESILGTDKT